MLLKHPVFILCVISFCIYFSSFFNKFVWDDEQFIYRNAYVSNFAVKEIFTTNTVAGAGEISNYYRPLTTLSFAIDYQFWQLNPFGYHIVNTLLHTLTGVLLFLLLKKLKFSKELSFASSLLFLVHPVQTEAVAYVNSRGDSLFSFFLMLSLFLLALSFENKSIKFKIYNAEFIVGNTVLLGATIVTFIASVLSKEIALAGLGLHGLVLARYFLISKQSIKKYFKDHVSQFLSFIFNCVAVGIYLFLRSTVLNFSNSFNFYNDSSLYAENISVRLYTFLKIIFIYIKMFFIPYPLHMERNTSVITSPFNVWLLAFLLLTLVLGFLSYLQWKKDKQTTILFGWAWSACMLIPVSGIIAINGLLYEHWLYLPLIGFFILIYGCSELLAPQLLQKRVTKYIFYFIVFVFCILTIRQNYFWSTPIRLYTHLLEYTDSARIHNNLAMSYSDEKQYENALSHYQSALEYGQPYPQIYHNMGNTYLAVSDSAAAESSFKKALELDPSFYHTYINLIKLYLSQKKFEQALVVAHLAQQNYPEDIDYQILELEILRTAQNKNSFDEKKKDLLARYSADQKITSYISALQYIQE